jgi:hypothetical protein
MDWSAIDEMTKVIQSISSTIQSCVTVIAIIVGGCWFIKRRKKFPKLIITNEVIHKKLPGGKAFIHVIVQAENIGDVLVKPISGEIRLLQILPLIGEIAVAVEKGNNPIKKRSNRN